MEDRELVMFWLAGDHKFGNFSDLTQKKGF